MTKAQKVAAVIAGVPVISNLLAAFGIFAPSPAQQHALTETMTWAAVAAGLLVASDAHIRGKRNDAVAAVQVAEVNAGTPSEPDAPIGVALHDVKPGDPVKVIVGSNQPVPAVVTGTLRDMLADAPIPAAPLDADEVELADPALDDPTVDGAAGVSRTALGDHYAAAAAPEDVAERDARMNRATATGTRGS